VIVVRDGGAGRRQAVTDHGIVTTGAVPLGLHNHSGVASIDQAPRGSFRGVLQVDGGKYGTGKGPSTSVEPEALVLMKGSEDDLSTKATVHDGEHLQLSTGGAAGGFDVEWEEAGEEHGEGGEGEGQQLEPLKPPPRSFVHTFTCLPWEVSQQQS
jgi:hypothetical protein